MKRTGNWSRFAYLYTDRKRIADVTASEHSSNAVDTVSSSLPIN
jgi:hypothetical protein